MPQIRPIGAVRYQAPANGDISACIAPPYDVLDTDSKAALLSAGPTNIVAVDLPHLPPKTVGPDATYEQAGELYRAWLADGTLRDCQKPALYAYRQTFTLSPEVATPSHPAGKPIQRIGLFANLALQTLGHAKPGAGGIYPHEQTFSAPKEDRLKLMRATRAQLSPIFGMYSDAAGAVSALLKSVIDAAAPMVTGTTAWDGVRHELWPIESFDEMDRIAAHLAKTDVLIADGHHRYNTALNYQQELAQSLGELPPDHPANFCMFVLIATQDPGMLLLPTHRVLGGMNGFSLDKFAAAAKGRLNCTSFSGDLAALESALPGAGRHAMGLYDPASPTEKMMIATTTDHDPLAKTHPEQSSAWRHLDVAVAQHLVVEQLCEPNFCDQGKNVAWKFPHSLAQVDQVLVDPGYQLGLIMQATPLEAVSQVSEAGELMPQKSTFFYPKVATGLVIHPLA